MRRNQQAKCTTAVLAALCVVYSVDYYQRVQETSAPPDSGSESQNESDPAADCSPVYGDLWTLASTRVRIDSIEARRRCEAATEQMVLDVDRIATGISQTCCREDEPRVMDDGRDRFDWLEDCCSRSGSVFAAEPWHAVLYGATEREYKATLPGTAPRAKMDKIMRARCVMLCDAPPNATTSSTSPMLADAVSRLSHERGQECTSVFRKSGSQQMLQRAFLRDMYAMYQLGDRCALRYLAANSNHAEQAMRDRIMAYDDLL